MRRFPLLSLATLLVASSGAAAQTNVVPEAQPPASSERGGRTQIASQLTLLKLTGTGDNLPSADSFTIGDRTVAAGTTVNGPVGVSEGSVDVRGTVQGSVVAIEGDVRIHDGAVITGDAIAIGGRVSVTGGSVGGEIRSLNTLLPTKTFAVAVERGRWHSLKLVFGWFVVLAIVGIGSMLFAERNFDGVTLALGRSGGVARSFFAGLVGQVIALPALLLLIVALALTVIGILLIPFAIVAFVLAVMGLVALGFLAVARLTGSLVVADTPPESGTESHGMAGLRALLVGLVVYLSLWAVAALFQSVPFVATLLRGIAFGITWTAATVGLGATLLSRVGTYRVPTSPASPSTDTDPLSWETPTPIAGVAASRRGASRGVT
jgi:hypothetical protein